MIFPKRWIDMAAMFDSLGADLLYFDCNIIASIMDRDCSATSAKNPNIIQGVWGFIDGTVRPIYRPEMDQEAVYNGQKRVHAIKSRTIITSD
ncbi:hypothetical protein PHMEG_00039045 [Phytophthora megakarya]|uniref:Uncharacterized protein n=1 Tax=Phytophthora megakarya TaxID=4795 RepID=A0A225UG76_9STRA|nr:hypothetical protein PHMEG_00039045 [Phytophthora megakarya]